MRVRVRVKVRIRVRVRAHGLQVRDVHSGVRRQRSELGLRLRIATLGGGGLLSPREGEVAPHGLVRVRGRGKGKG